MLETLLRLHKIASRRRLHAAPPYFAYFWVWVIHRSDRKDPLGQSLGDTLLTSNQLMTRDVLACPQANERTIKASFLL